MTGRLGTGAQACSSLYASSSDSIHKVAYKETCAWAVWRSHTAHAHKKSMRPACGPNRRIVGAYSCGRLGVGALSPPCFSPHLETCRVDSCLCSGARCKVAQRGAVEARNPLIGWGNKLDRETLPSIECVQSCDNFKPTGIGGFPASVYLALQQDDGAVGQMVGEMDALVTRMAQRNSDRIAYVV